ncbi:pseudaminic acid cytidylyltransferase [Pelagibacteraceae bacterium]|nr:pseudaminic acid cytidylyltransferase [Pelagibacteraceae bacterium]MDC1158783.1 pseudaminic acid cytidylyltransferase [Pelagibacteraceae bacterium]
MKIAIIPARGGSKRVPKKNIRLFKKIPAIGRVISILKKSKIFDIIIVSTDSPEIAEVAKKYKAEVPFLRPKNLSGDFATTQSVIKHSIKWLNNKSIYPKYVCCVYSTAFFLKPKDLLNGFKVLKKGKYKFIFAAAKDIVTAYKSFEKNLEDLKFLSNKFQQKRTQDIRDTYHDSGQFYLAESKNWLSEKSILGKKSFIVEIPRERDHDIDTLRDWEIAEKSFK